MKSKRWKRRNRHKGKSVLLFLPMTFDVVDIYMMHKPQPHKCLQDHYDKWRQSIYDKMI